MRHCRKIHYFLRVGGSEHGKPGLAAGHDVLVVAENGQRVRGERTCGAVNYSGQQFAGHFVHVRDHEQQSLRSGKRSRQGAGGQGAVHGAGRAGFRLHLHNLNLLSKNIFSSVSRPLVHNFGHNGRRGDGIDTGNIGKRIGHMGRSSVAVHRFHFPCHSMSSYRYIYEISKTRKEHSA